MHGWHNRRNSGAWHPGKTLSIGESMELILWRHADAEDGMNDMARKLTAKGHKQAEKMAEWLRDHVTQPYRVVASPAVRARETADYLAAQYNIEPLIAPGCSAASILTAAGWPDAKGTVIIVGHQPALGAAAAFLLAGQEMPWSIKKSAIWWLSNRVRLGEHQTVLRCSLTSDML